MPHTPTAPPAGRLLPSPEALFAAIDLLLKGSRWSRSAPVAHHADDDLPSVGWAA